MNEQNVQVAMNIILNAGDARLACQKALDQMSGFHFEEAKTLMKEAHDKITIAHRQQTNAIQGETNGEKSEYSLLFAHAQDTLMTINSEILMSEKMLKVFEQIDQRISKGGF